MPEILGTICTEIQELRRVASIKRKTYQEISVPNEQVPAYLNQDWTVVRQSVTRTRLKKPKANAVLFEDRIWMIFYQLGFQCMNTDRNCKLKFNGVENEKRRSLPNSGGSGCKVVLFDGVNQMS